MSDDELRISMAQAKRPREQIQVLADLNAVSPAEMEAHLRELGAEIPGAPQRSPSRGGRKLTFSEDRALALLAEGKTDLQIAEMVGVSKAAIQGWRARAGLPCNREPRRPSAPKKPAPGPAPAVPDTPVPGTISAGHLARLLAAAAELDPDAAVVLSGRQVRQVEVTVRAGGGNEMRVEVRVE